MTLAQARAHLQKVRHVAVLTGAGISAESGIPTFRSVEGLWRNYRPEDLANPDAYARDPETIWEWYLWRLETVLKAQPNPAHYALATLESTHSLSLVTQNVDGLHTRAGSRGVLELHGTITQSRCEACGHLDTLALGQKAIPHCSVCGNRARPNVVWFGEMLPDGMMERASEAFYRCDIALVIGTSGMVQPAASLAMLAKEAGAMVIEINPERTPLTPFADYAMHSSASLALAELIDT